MAVRTITSKGRQDHDARRMESIRAVSHARLAGLLPTAGAPVATYQRDVALVVVIHPSDAHVAHALAAALGCTVATAPGALWIECLEVPPHGPAMLAALGVRVRAL